jgi:hypothetical protein
MNEDELEFIKGYENLYKINRKGQIWSCWFNRFMTPLTNKDGYLFITLKKEKVRKKGFIHRLLALQYLDNPDNLPQIDHIDRNKTNNILSNLRWCSQHTNRQNRCDILANKTPEELKEREDKIREYKKIKAREYRQKHLAKKVFISN